ncbi:hypothetical protein IF1G_02022 [Cordyceps javanica]|uniref:Uncharacterized protein n=1 Tax=Cordyceps javanica TaxID=43265 RepID=A0A545W9H1_9HYPO|nr:hypothetical protein IF1G_02022 [Cordyceps javanica]TQW10525.1 POU domain, class 2, associating factor 1 domain-containing protein [Cordyceps javanica]
MRSAATGVFNRTLTNLGPLTTTFTPAPSCSALASEPGAGYIFWAGPLNAARPANGQHVPYGSVACTPQDLATCYPDGEARQSILARGYEFTQPYHSPGYYCPAGWTAVASASFDSAWGNRDMPTGYDAVVTAFALEVLRPSETVTVCCPSGYQPFAGDVQFQVGCTSRLGPASSYGVSERCFNDRPTTTVNFLFWDHRVTKIEPVSDASTSFTQLPLETLTSPTSYEIFHTMPNIVLVNNGQASATTTTTTTPPAPTSATPTAAGDGKNGRKSAAVGRRAKAPLAVAVAVLASATVLFLA